MTEIQTSVKCQLLAYKNFTQMDVHKSTPDPHSNCIIRKHNSCISEALKHAQLAKV